MTDDKKREAARERKRRQRQREKELDIQEVRLKLSKVDRERLETMCKARAVTGEPYDMDEYITLLIDRDWQKLQQQLKELNGQCCGKCKDPLPGGCNGLFKGDSACYHTWPNWKDLRL
ncbi:hypothetical protein [Vibrio parahaemolyticus]|uniref:hypothetical protein n=1 Tax=Vibrio parahaemolyticus TaxID=670 RepID=UPI000789B767|nr:hypothetical protein [Vibrio parahaemolyticus]KYO58422.1 hypothetical protein AU461_23175 [Vibrio parahaemolyticus]KYX47745.1 hypothetical protein AU389_02075 [Vibrio parahaemolyticus]TPB41766.1 hypothetical protein DXJ78_24020 [Vibrio parahaemolyticus]